MRADVVRNLCDLDALDLLEQRIFDQVYSLIRSVIPAPRALLSQEQFMPQHCMSASRPLKHRYLLQMPVHNLLGEMAALPPARHHVHVSAARPAC